MFKVCRKRVRLSAGKELFSFMQVKFVSEMCYNKKKVSYPCKARFQ